MKHIFLLLSFFVVTHLAAMQEPLWKKQRIEEKKDTSLFGKIPIDIKKIIIHKMLEKTCREQEDDELSMAIFETEQSKRNLKAFKKSLQGIRRYVAHEQQFKNSFQSMDTTQFIRSLVKNPPDYYTVYNSYAETGIEVKRLLIAAAFGTPKAANLLDNQIAFISKIEDEIQLTLFHAAAYNFTQPFKFLIKRFPYYKDTVAINPHDKDEMYTSLLLVATQEKNAELVNTLLKFGANIHYVNDEGQSALMVALEHNDERIARMLLKARAHPPCNPRWWYTISKKVKNKALQLLREYDAIDIETACVLGLPDIIIKKVRSDHHHINIADDFKSLYHCASYLEIILDRAQQLPIPNLSLTVDTLLDLGINVNSYYGSALTSALFLKDMRIAQKILNAGASIEDLYLPYWNDHTISNIEAAILKNPTCVAFLVKNGVNLDRKNGKGNTPLITATQTNNSAAVKELLKFGVDHSLQNNKGKSALLIAMEKVNIELIKILSHPWAHKK